MQVELSCGRCSCRFVAAPNTPAGDIVERMIDEGPWYALGEGETFEDMIFSALMERGAIFCPDCGSPIAVSEESLGQLAQSLTLGWCIAGRVDQQRFTAGNISQRDAKFGKRIHRNEARADRPCHDPMFLWRDRN